MGNRSLVQGAGTLQAAGSLVDRCILLAGHIQLAGALQEARRQEGNPEPALELPDIQVQRVEPKAWEHLDSSN